MAIDMTKLVFEDDVPNPNPTNPITKDENPNPEAVGGNDPIDPVTTPPASDDNTGSDDVAPEGEQYSIDDNDNLVVVRDGKSYIVANKGGYSYDGETGEVELGNDLNVDLAIMNSEIQETFSDILEVLPAEQRAVAYDGSVSSLKELVVTLAKADYTHTLNQLAAGKPEVFRFLQHLDEGGDVKDFIPSGSNRIDLTKLPETPNAENILNVVTTYLKDVLQTPDVDGFVKVLTDSEQLKAYYDIAKTGLAVHYSNSDKLEQERRTLKEQAEKAEAQKYWSAVTAKVNALDLGGLKLSTQKEATEFMEFITPKAGAKSKEEEYASKMSGEQDLAERFLRFKIASGQLKLADLNKLFAPKTKDATVRIVKAIRTKENSNPAPPTQSSKVTGGSKGEVDLSKIVF